MPTSERAKRAAEEILKRIGEIGATEVRGLRYKNEFAAIVDAEFSGTTEQVQKLREALEGIEARQMEDGSPCWCVSPDYRDQYRVILEPGEHTWYCQQARTALAESEPEKRIPETIPLGLEKMERFHDSCGTPLRSHFVTGTGVTSPQPRPPNEHQEEIADLQQQIIDLTCELQVAPCGHRNADWVENQGQGHNDRRITNIGGHCARCVEIERIQKKAYELGLKTGLANTEGIEKAVSEALESAVARVRKAWDSPPVPWMALGRPPLVNVEAAIRGKEEDEKTMTEKMKEQLAELWGLLCPDCGPEDYERILADTIQAVETSRRSPTVIGNKIAEAIGTLRGG
jgi:hypothetical protein